MINNKAIEYASNIDAKLQEQKIELVPLEGTFIANSIGEKFVNFETEDHDVLIDGYVKDVSNAIRIIGNHMTKVVSPEIERFKTIFLSDDNNRKLLEYPEYGFKLIEISIPYVFENNVIESWLQEVPSDTRYERAQGNFGLVELFQKDPVSLSKTNIEELDAYTYAELVHNKDINDVSVILEKFTSATELDLVNFKAHDVEINEYAKWLCLIATMYKNISLMRNEGEYIDGVSAPAAHCFKFYMSIVRRIMDRIKKAMTGDQVFCPFYTNITEQSFEDPNNMCKNIAVFRPSITKFLDSGIGLGPLYGFIISGGNLHRATCKDIMENSEEYEQVWESKKNLMMAKIKEVNIKLTKSKLHGAFKTAYKESVQEFSQRPDFNELSDKEKVDFLGVLDPLEMDRRLSVYIDALSSESKLSVHQVALELVLDCRYRDYASSDILKKIYSGLDNLDEELSEEKIVQVQAELIVDFLLDGIKIKS